MSHAAFCVKVMQDALDGALAFHLADTPEFAAVVDAMHATRVELELVAELPAAIHQGPVVPAGHNRWDCSQVNLQPLAALLQRCSAREPQMGRLRALITEASVVLSLRSALLQSNQDWLRVDGILSSIQRRPDGAVDADQFPNSAAEIETIDSAAKFMARCRRRDLRRQEECTTST